MDNGNVAGRTAGRRLGLALLACGLCASSASAQSFYEAFLAPNGPAAPCYAKQNADSGSRLVPERRQRLKRFYLKAGDNLGLLPPRAFRIAFGFTVGDAQEAFAGTASCEAVGPAARCTVAGDGGRFTLTPRDDGLRLTIGNKLILARPSRFSPDLADGQDDLVFFLAPADVAACMAEPTS